MNWDETVDPDLEDLVKAELRAERTKLQQPQRRNPRHFAPWGSTKGLDRAEIERRMREFYSRQGLNDGCPAARANALQDERKEANAE